MRKLKTFKELCIQDKVYRVCKDTGVIKALKIVFISDTEVIVDTTQDSGYNKELEYSNCTYKGVSYAESSTIYCSDEIFAHKMSKIFIRKYNTRVIKDYRANISKMIARIRESQQILKDLEQ